MQQYRITVRVTDDKKGAIYPDVICLDASSLEEAARLANAFATGHARNEDVSECIVDRIERIWPA